MQSDNKRIAKNTLALYFRMMFLMCLSLYTTRVILKALGVVDYGIYNVVGGIVGMMAFINSSMSMASNRYFAYAIGRKDKDLLQRSFSMSMEIHFLISVIVLILAETVGLWYLHNYLNVPESSQDTAEFVYHLSVLGCIVAINKVPLTAMFVAHEDMSVYAYISILEGVLKLAIALLLTVLPFEKLRVYAVLVLCAGVLMFGLWLLLCYRKYSQIRYRPLWDKNLFKEMSSFISWQFVGSFGWMIHGQGTGLVLNFFFGPALNAASSVATQVKGGVESFVSSFRMAVNPQLVKDYAVGNFQKMERRIAQSSKYSFFLLYIFALPVLVEADSILNIWLSDIPPYGVIFVRMTLIAAMFEMLSGTTSYAYLATEKIRNYELVTTAILLSEIAFVYIVFKVIELPYLMFYVQFVLYTILLFVKLLFLRNRIGLSIRGFARYALAPEFLVVVATVPIALLISYMFRGVWLGFIPSMVVSALVACALIYLLGMSNSERHTVISSIRAKLLRK